MENNVFDNARHLRRIVSVHNLFGASWYTPLESQQSRIKYPAFSLLYCEKGELFIEIKNRTFVVQDGDCLFIAPFTEYVISSRQKGVRMFYAVFSVKENSISLFCEQLITLTPFARNLLVRLGKLADEFFISNKTASLVKLPEPKDDVSAFAEQSVKEMLELFIIECIKPVDKSIISQFSEETATTESKKVTSNIYSYLAKNVYERITLDDVSEALYFSKSYIKTAFKKETGKTIMEAFNELKIEEAKKLIESGMPMNEIAEKMSFCNKNYFSTLFKAKSGQTPTEYRKSLL